jgi:hypothetical protein
MAGLATAVSAIAAMLITNNDPPAPKAPTPATPSVVEPLASVKPKSSGGKGAGAGGENIPSTKKPTSKSRPKPNPAPAPPVLRVTGASASAETSIGGDPCSVDIRLSGSITVEGGSGTVTYHWLGDEGVAGEDQTLEFDGPGTLDVVDDTDTRAADPSAASSGWHQIEVTEPQALSSEPATFEIGCAEEEPEQPEEPGGESAETG